MSTEEKITSESGIRIDFDCAEYYGYPAYYSAGGSMYEAPIGNIRIENGSGSIRDLTVRISSEPEIFKEIVYKGYNIYPDSVFEFKCPKADTDPSALALLPSDASVRYTAWVEDGEGRLLARCDKSARLAAITSWGGVHFYPELAAAFAVPDSEAVKALAERARSLYGSSYGSDGYISKTREDVVRVLHSVYNALKETGITYSTRSFYPDEKGVYVSPPELTLERRSGNSMEIALAAVSVAEAMGLNTVLAFTSENTLPGVFTENISFSLPVNRDIDEVRRAVEEERLIFFDPSSVINGVNVAFGSSEERASLSLSRDDKFYLALDISALRRRGVCPLPERVVTPDGLCFAGTGEILPEGYFDISSDGSDYDTGKQTKERIRREKKRLEGVFASAVGSGFLESGVRAVLTDGAERVFKSIACGKGYKGRMTGSGRNIRTSFEPLRAEEIIKDYEVRRYTGAAREEAVVSLINITYRDEGRGVVDTAPFILMPVKVSCDIESSNMLIESASDNRFIVNTLLTDRLSELFGIAFKPCSLLREGDISDAVKYIKDHTFGFAKDEIYIDEDHAELNFKDMTPFTAMRSTFSDRFSCVSKDDRIRASLYKHTPGFNSLKGLEEKSVGDIATELLMDPVQRKAFVTLKDGGDALMSFDSPYAKAEFIYKIAAEYMKEGKRVLYTCSSLRSAMMLRSLFDENGIESYRDLVSSKINSEELFHNDELYRRSDLPSLDPSDKTEDIRTSLSIHNSYFTEIMKRYPFGLSFVSACKGYFSVSDRRYAPAFREQRLHKMTRRDMEELFEAVSLYLDTAEDMMNALGGGNIFDTPLSHIFVTSVSDEDDDRLVRDAKEMLSSLANAFSQLKENYGYLTSLLFGKELLPVKGKTERLCAFFSLLNENRSAAPYVSDKGDISLYSDARIALSLLKEARELKRGRELFGEELSSLPQLPPDPVTFRDSYTESVKKGFFAKRGAKSMLVKQFENLLSDPSLMNADKAEVYAMRLARAYELEQKADISSARAIFGDNEDISLMEGMAEALYTVANETEAMWSLFEGETDTDASELMRGRVKDILLRLDPKGEGRDIMNRVTALKKADEDIAELSRSLIQMLFMKDVPEIGEGKGYDEAEIFYTSVKDSLDCLKLWCAWRSACVTADRLGFESMTELFRNNIITVDEARDAFVRGFYKTVCGYIISQSEVLSSFDGKGYDENTERLISLGLKEESLIQRRIRRSEDVYTVIASVTDIPSGFFERKEVFDLVIFDDGGILPASLLSAVSSLGRTLLTASLWDEKDTWTDTDGAMCIVPPREEMSAFSLAMRVMDRYYSCGAFAHSPYRTASSVMPQRDGVTEPKRVKLIRTGGMCLTSRVHYEAKGYMRADEAIRSSLINTGEAEAVLNEAERIWKEEKDIRTLTVYTLTEAQRLLIDTEAEKRGIKKLFHAFNTECIDTERIIYADAVIFSVVQAVPESNIYPSELPYPGGVFIRGRGEAALRRVFTSARELFAAVTSLNEKNLSLSSYVFDSFAPLKRFLTRLFFSDLSRNSSGREGYPLTHTGRYHLSLRKTGEEDMNHTVFDEEAFSFPCLYTCGRRAYTADIFRSSVEKDK